MQAIYWTSHKVTRKGLLAVAALALLSVYLVERLPHKGTDEQLRQQAEATRLAARYMETLKAERLRRGLPLEPVFDPAQSGMIGVAMSEVTSRPADLVCKQTSVNPHFGAVVVDLLHQAGVERGDTIAVGWSGSFPALNVAVCAAIESMQLRPVIVASATSSQYGANLPAWMWVDMERHLAEQNLITFRSLAVSLGGAADRGMGMSEPARDTIRQAVARNDLPLLETSRLHQSLERRTELYTQHFGNQPPRVYINVGGGIASTGGSKGKALIQPGLNRQVAQPQDVDCMIVRFAARNCPVIHLNEVVKLAEEYDLPVAPQEMPQPGERDVLSASRKYNRPLAACLLVVVLSGAYQGYGRRRPKQIPIPNLTQSA